MKRLLDKITHAVFVVHQDQRAREQIVQSDPVTILQRVSGRKRDAHRVVHEVRDSQLGVELRRTADTEVRLAGLHISDDSLRDGVSQSDRDPGVLGFEGGEHLGQ